MIARVRWVRGTKWTHPLSTNPEMHYIGTGHFVFSFIRQPLETSTYFNSNRAVVFRAHFNTSSEMAPERLALSSGLVQEIEVTAVDTKDEYGEWHMTFVKVA